MLKDPIIKVLFERIGSLFPGEIEEDIKSNRYDENLCGLMIEVLQEFKERLYKENQLVMDMMDVIEWVSIEGNEELQNSVMVCFLEGLAFSSTWEPEIAEAVVGHMGENTKQQWNLFLES